MKKSAAIASFLMLLAASLQAQTVFPNFCDVSSFSLNGAAASLNPNADCVLRLTNTTGQSSSAFLNNTVSLASDASFSTFFSFQIPNPVGISDPDGVGADGLVFVIQTVASNVGGSGGGIGYEGIPDSVGIEFDTYFNGWDPDGNHIGVNLEGIITSVATVGVPTRMNDGDTWYAWVDYNGVTDVLEVRFASTAVRPAAAILTHSVDLVSVLGTTNAFVGFTSGTGGAGGTHEIGSWQFNATFAPIDPSAGPVVTINATDPTAAEPSNPGQFTVTRTGATTSALVVNYTVGGTATAGSDYTTLSGTVTIPIGQSSATIAVTPIDDILVEPSETVIATLSTSTAYAIGNQSSATVVITSDDVGVAIPTASEWGLLLLASMLALAGCGLVMKR